MKIPWGLLVGGAVLLAIGFFGGRASVRIDDQELRDSLAVYREHRKDDAAENARIRNELKDEHERRVRLEAVTLTLTESAARLISGAGRTMVAANEKQRLADSLLASLKNARTAGDTIAILTNACTERGNECKLVRKANDSLLLATDTLNAVNDTAKQAIASFRRDSATMVKRINRDSIRLAEADGLVTKLERHARGCRIPFVGVPCPVGMVTYNLDAPEPGILNALQCSGGIPIRPWLIAGVTTRCVPKGKP